MRNIVVILLFFAALSSCTMKFGNESSDEKNLVEIVRYDRIETSYLTTGDFAAMQTLSTEYPVETRTLIEDVLHIGEVNDSEINSRLLKFYQDSTLQTIISDVQHQYKDVDDLNKELSKAFMNMRKKLPNIKIPHVYTQIGALDQSIIIGNNSIAISLDKYLGKDYEIYKRYYPEDQRMQMERRYIVPEAVTFYLLSIYPLAGFQQATQEERDEHIGRIFAVANKILNEDFYDMPNVKLAEKKLNDSKKSYHDFLLSK